MASERQPYIGPRPFEQSDHGLFFGRDRETRDLRSLVTAHQVVLFYARSGTGKTSLLNAGLIPALEAGQFEVLPVARVRGRTPEDLQFDQISNIYAINTLMSWAEREVDPTLLGQRSLVEFLEQREHRVGEQGTPSFRVVIFDQFEELFSSYQGQRRDREEFFQQVADAVEQDPLLRVVFAMREDDVAELDPYAHFMTEKLRTRYRMERLGSEAARSAVEGPLRDTGRSFAKGVVSSLVRQLQLVTARVDSATEDKVEMPGEYVEPVLLQVVCQSLWSKLAPDVTNITCSHLDTFGNLKRVLRDFYETAIEKARKEKGIKEGDLRSWFDYKLITPLGTRGTAVRGREKTDGVPNAVVEVLEAEHIIRAERRAGARWYELTHDQLIEPIRESNEAWRQYKRVGRITSSVGAAAIGLALFFLLWIGLFGIIGPTAESYVMALGNRFASKEFHENIVMIPIDEKVEEEVDYPFGPNWRRKHATLVTNLSKAGAKVVVFAMHFEGSTDFDGEFSKAIARARQENGTRVIFGVRSFVSGEPNLEEELRTAAGGWGAITLGTGWGYGFVAPLVINKQAVSELIPGLVPSESLMKGMRASL